MRNLRIGVGIIAQGGTKSGLAGLLARFRRAEEAGFQSAWVANAFGFDAMTLVALAGRETERIELATAVVPTYSRHPLYMAQQALSTQAATKGRFVLGLGPSHELVIGGMLGLRWEKPGRHVREYLTVVRELIETGKASFRGSLYRVEAGLELAGLAPCPILIGALGPVMRRIAGRLADGTITWMTGPRTLGETLVPELRAAARAAGRPEPRVVAGFPVSVTDDAAGARAVASKLLALYGTLPSYRAMLDAEGAASPGEVAIVGNEREVERQLEALASVGVTDLNAVIFPHGSDPSESRRRSFELLAELARR